MSLTTRMINSEIYPTERGSGTSCVNKMERIQVTENSSFWSGVKLDHR